MTATENSARQNKSYNNFIVIVIWTSNRFRKFRDVERTNVSYVCDAFVHMGIGT